MKKSVYKDYTKASEYFTDENPELLSQEINDVEKQKKFIVWVQEFSKKIVVVIFIFYLLSSILSLFFVYLTYKQGIIAGLDTLITEINTTFREVVGGYIIKSAVENSVKIAGNYYVGICNARLKAMKEGLSEKGIKGFKTESGDINNNDYDNVEAVGFEEDDFEDTTY